MTEIKTKNVVHKKDSNVRAKKKPSVRITHRGEIKIKAAKLTKILRERDSKRGGLLYNVDARFENIDVRTPDYVINGDMNYPSLKRFLLDAGKGDLAALERLTMEGVGIKAVENLCKGIAMPLGRVAAMLHLSPSTLERRKEKGVLNPGPESERVVRYGIIVRLAIELFEGNEKKAVRWLKTPLEFFEGKTPLEKAMTELGAKEVENLIGALEHGVFS